MTRILGALILIFITTKVFAGVAYVDSFRVTRDGEPRSLAFNTDGTKMFVAGSNGRDINVYTLSTGFDVNKLLSYIK